LSDFEKWLIRTASKIKDPVEVQEILYEIDYNSAESMKSAQKVWETRSAHCLEAVHLAAAILEKCHFPPLVLSLDSADNICHVVYVFRGPRGWGSLGRSKEEGLHGRAPVFKTIRDLAKSYFAPYVDDSGLLTGYALVNLNESKSNWRTSRRNVWASEQFILSSPHKKLNVSKKEFVQAVEAYKAGGHRPQPYWW